MSDEKPENNSSSNSGPTQSGNNNMDWRDQRRQWRHEMHEMRNRDPLRGLFWGLLLILIGILFFVDQQQGTSWDILWKYLLIGLGAIFIIDGLVHYWNPAYRERNWGKFIPGIILIFVGLAFLFNFSQWWPIILIGVGVAILISFFFRRN